MHGPLLENQYKDVSVSERNIAHETLLKNNSADVSENTITKLKDEDHKKHSVTQKVKSYFNIFECGRNLLDQLEVAYQ